MIKQNHVWIRLWSTELMIMFGIFDGKVTKKGAMLFTGPIDIALGCLFGSRKLFEVH